MYGALARGLTDASPVPTSVAAGDRLSWDGVPQALGDCVCGTLLATALGDGCESDDADATAATLMTALTDA